LGFSSTVCILLDITIPRYGIQTFANAVMAFENNPRPTGL